MKKRRYQLAGVGLSILLLSSSSASKDLFYRQTIAERSRVGALARAEVELLGRKPGPGRDLVFNEVLARFAPGGSDGAQPDRMTVVSSVDAISALGDGWWLEVRGDGECVRWRDWTRLNRETDVLPELARAPADTEVISWAWSYIEDSLWPFVLLAKEQELQPWSRQNLVKFVAERGGVLRQWVQATWVVFTRTYRGVPVVGTGSKVGVLLTPDGAAAGFDLDWSELEPTGRSVEVAEAGLVRARARARLGLDSPHLVQWVDQGRWECGYFDSGVDGREGGELLWPACVVLSGPTGPGAPPQLADIVPASASLDSGGK